MNYQLRVHRSSPPSLISLQESLIAKAQTDISGLLPHDRVKKVDQCVISFPVNTNESIVVNLEEVVAMEMLEAGWEGGAGVDKIVFLVLFSGSWGW